ncbi:MAG: hypothetical protein AB7T08_11305, partial [Hyphomonadaceae bacterium]
MREVEIARRRTAMEAKGAVAWKPGKRHRKVSTALKAYADSKIPSIVLTNRHLTASHEMVEDIGLLFLLETRTIRL